MSRAHICSCVPRIDEFPGPHVHMYLGSMNVQGPHMFCIPGIDECLGPTYVCSCIPGIDECLGPTYVPMYLGLMNVQGPMFLCSSWDQTKCFARGNFFNSCCSLPQGKGQRLSEQNKNIHKVNSTQYQK